MRKLVLILIAFIAVVTFIRAFDNNGGINSAVINSERIYSGGISGELGTGETAAIVVN